MEQEYTNEEIGEMLINIARIAVSCRELRNELDVMIEALSPITDRLVKEFSEV